jgi:uncharacterized membrane protein (DUF4010 family)
MDKLTNVVNFVNTPEFKFFISLLIGFLIGLEREIRGKLGQDVYAGIRTFPMIAVLGTLSAWISDSFYKPFLGLSYLGLLLLSAVNYWIGVQKRTGITTEVAVFITFTLGVLVYYGFYYESILFAVVVTFLLATKRVLEGFANHLDVEDIFLILKFLAISVLIYPLLPDKELFYGINPRSVWKFVILVSSVSFLGYFLLKIYASKGDTSKVKKSLIITAILGGTVSSTAVTVAFSQLSRQLPQFSNVLFFGITLAWIVMAFRVVFLVTVLKPELFLPSLKLFLPFILLMLAVGLIFWKKEMISSEKRIQLKGNITLKNPFSLSEIFQFTVIYIAVAISGEILNQYFGSKGILILSLLSGVIDVDPITLTLVDMYSKGQIFLNTTLLGILLATISNNFFKAFYTYLFGSRELKRYITLLVLINVFYAISVLGFWRYIEKGKEN